MVSHNGPKRYLNITVMGGDITKHPRIETEHKRGRLLRRQHSIDATIMRIININLQAPFLGNIMWRFAAMRRKNRFTLSVRPPKYSRAQSSLSFRKRVSNHKFMLYFC